MASDSFYRFPLLPREIRNQIFLYATPPRIVHVQLEYPEYNNSDEEQEEFEEWLSNLVPAQTDQIKLHPSLAYFVHNWGPIVRSYYDRPLQPSLESYGFTNSKPVQYLWEDPKIPINWLLDHPTIAYQFLRKNHLYSTAPIPALLHTCRESREVLTRTGYRLAFGTRNHEPRTWFHYENDVLYLDSDRRNTGDVSLMSCSDWIVGEIDPESLQQVRKVALAGACCQLVRKYSRHEVLNAIRLLPKLEMLYVTEWSKCSIDRLLRKEWRSSSYLPSSTQDTDTILQSGNYTREAWRCTSIEEADCLFSLVGGYPPRYCESYSLGRQGSQLKYYQGPSGQYFQRLIDEFTQYLRDEREKADQHEGAVLWQIPRVKMVHICTEPMARLLFEERHRVWEKLVLLKRRQTLWEQHQKKGRNAHMNERLSRRNTLDRPEVLDGDDTPPSPTDLEWQDDWEAYDEANCGYDSDGYDVEYLVKRGRISPPTEVLSLEP
ncbi:hypothetical protein GGR53DRAFT_506421 [Hypoxylon sp. FL1150]|nr:hypothetical protein GGR53DRAFT_506421 [Hypoxylon sp. FL1150]